MGACCSSAPEPPSPPIPEGVTRICIAGGVSSPHVARARQIASLIAHKHSDKYETWFHFQSPGVCCDGHYTYIVEKTKDVKFPEHLKNHSTMPFIWMETGPAKTWTVIGGRQELADWAKKEFPEDAELIDIANNWKVSEACHGACCCAYDESDPKDAKYFSTSLKRKNQPVAGSDAPLTKN